jgi:hypothetical protein
VNLDCRFLFRPDSQSIRWRRTPTYRTHTHVRARSCARTLMCAHARLAFFFFLVYVGFEYIGIAPVTCGSQPYDLPLGGATERHEPPCNCAPSSALGINALNEPHDLGGCDRKTRALQLCFLRGAWLDQFRGTRRHGNEIQAFATTRFYLLTVDRVSSVANLAVR